MIIEGFFNIFISDLIIYTKGNILFIYNLTTVSKICNEHIPLLPKVWLKIIVLRHIFSTVTEILGFWGG